MAVEPEGVTLPCHQWEKLGVRMPKASQLRSLLVWNSSLEPTCSWLLSGAARIRAISFTCEATVLIQMPSPKKKEKE
jgi:hypothetical protein